MKRLATWLVTALVILAAAQSFAADPTAAPGAGGLQIISSGTPAAGPADDLLTRASNVLNAHGTGMRDVEIITRDPHGKETAWRGREARGVKDGKRSVLLVLEEPSSVRNFAVLARSDDDKTHEMWVYVPPIERVRKLELVGAAQPFLGTALTFADLGLYDLAGDGTVRVTGESMIDGRSTTGIEIVPTDSRAYSRIVTYVSPEGVPVQRDYLDLAGRAWRELTYTTAKAPDGHTMVRGFTAKDVQTGYETELRYGNMQTATLTDEVFAPESLATVVVERRLGSEGANAPTEAAGERKDESENVDARSSDGASDASQPR